MYKTTSALFSDEELEAIDASIREDEENERRSAEEAENADDNDDDRDELIRRELGDSDNDGAYDVVNKESTFDFSAFLIRFAHPHIIHALT